MTRNGTRRLLALDAQNVHAGRILLRPNQTKSGKVRVVPVPQDARAWLEDLPFATTYARLCKVWEDARQAIGRPDLRFHDLRHSYASMLAQAGESMTTARSAGSFQSDRDKPLLALVRCRTGRYWLATAEPERGFLRPNTEKREGRNANSRP